MLSACTFAPLVTHADALVKLSKRVLGDALTFSLVKHTFFAHFCAGAWAPGMLLDRGRQQWGCLRGRGAGAGQPGAACLCAPDAPRL